MQPLRQPVFAPPPPAAPASPGAAPNSAHAAGARGQGRQQSAGVRMTRSGREAGQAAAPPRAAALQVPGP